MIYEYYENPNKPPARAYPPIPPVVLGEPPSSPAAKSVSPFMTDSMVEFYARKKGCTPAEFIKRDNLIKAQAGLAQYGKGSIVYPHTKELYDSIGKVFVRGIYKGYNEYEGDWDEAVTYPYIVTANPVDKPNEVIYCTVGYLKIFEPV